MTKKCIKCHRRKDVKRFPKDRSKSDGRYNKCSDCNKRISRQYYKSRAGQARRKRYLQKRARVKRTAKRK